MKYTAERRANISAGLKRAYAAGGIVRTAKQLATSQNLKNGDGVTQSRRRMAQLEHEEREADKLRAEGFEVFSPTVVCDRIAVRDGKVYFVEFKKPGQVLRDGQQRIFDLMPQQYLVRYSEPKSGI